MSTQIPDQWRRRLFPLMSVGPYVLLAALAAYTAVTQRTAGTSLLVDLALCGLLAGWMLWFVTLHPAWRTRPGVMAVFLGGLVVIMLVLVLRAPWFGLFTPAGYVLAFRLLPWPRQLAAISAVGVVAGTAQASDMPKSNVFEILTFLAVLAANVLPMCLLSWVIWRGDEQYDQRARALEEIREANRKLEATLAENERLHRQLMVQAREAGALGERQRMAREIHDTLAQGLTGIVTQLQAAEQADGDQDRWRRHLRAATGLARESLSEARRSVHALRPVQLETAQLSDALADLADRWSVLHGVAVQFTSTGTARPLPPDTEAALLRTAQEALTNVAKHAAATRVGLTISYMERQVVLDVRDDGIGLSPDGGQGGGFGLIGMRERIEGLSGTLLIESEPGTGTAVSARVPVGGGA